MRYRTRYTEDGFDASIPRELWVEVHGQADCTLEQAISAYWSTANNLIPAIAVASNAPIDDLDVHIGFDATPGEREHQFFESFQAEETGGLRQTRPIPLAQTAAFLDALSTNNEFPRLLRACALYREALRYLKPGQEVLLVVFLWMAVEALTKVALRRACAAENCTEDDLVKKWALALPGADEDALREAKKRLDGEVRRRMIFHGDADCQRNSARASDAFEHGFEDFDRIRAFAVRASESGASQHVRKALFELLGLDPMTTDFLTSGRYAKPRSNWVFTKYARGSLLGEADNLAAPGHEYPVFDWSGRVKEVRRKEDDTYEVTYDENMTVVIGPEVHFRPDTLEIWGPENDPID